MTLVNVSRKKINGVWSASSETGAMGGAYKASGGTVQSTAYNWSTDWKITEFDESLITGLPHIVNTEANEQPIYNLSGMRVSKLQKGNIYIQGGNKIVKR